MYGNKNTVHESHHLRQTRPFSQYVDLPHIAMPITPSRSIDIVSDYPQGCKHLFFVFFQAILQILYILLTEPSATGKCGQKLLHGIVK